MKDILSAAVTTEGYASHGLAGEATKHRHGSTAQIVAKTIILIHFRVP
jgi:hypothetical protein